MDRVAVFIDAGYLIAEAGKTLYGSGHREELQVDTRAAIEALCKRAYELTSLPILRVYWYDASAGAMTPEQSALAYQNNVKVRLGIIVGGRQKGVDSLIVSDMITLAQNRAASEMILISGDEDLRIGVQKAQEHGVRVTLLLIGSPSRNASPLLVQEADCRGTFLGWLGTTMERPIKGACDDTGRLFGSRGAG